MRILQETSGCLTRKKILAGETLAEFKTRAGKSEEFDLSEHLDFITSREEILYSNAAVSEKQVNDAQKDYLALR